MNKVEIEGKVLAAWMSGKGGFITKIAVVHEHNVNGTVIMKESVFIAVMTDPEKIKKIDVVAGDKIRIIGHLNIDNGITSGGNSWSKMMLYADNIEVLKYAS